MAVIGEIYEHTTGQRTRVVAVFDSWLYGPCVTVESLNYIGPVDFKTFPDRPLYWTNWRRIGWEACMIRIHFSKLRSGAVTPTQAYTSAAGWDLSIAEDVHLEAGSGVQLLPTGLQCEIPSGYAGYIMGRSGLTRQGVIVHPGLIDSDYRGELLIMASLELRATRTWSGSYRVLKAHEDELILKAGTRVAQLVIWPTFPVAWLERAELTATERGEQGFGSSGV